MCPKIVELVSILRDIYRGTLGAPLLDKQNVIADRICCDIQHQNCIAIAKVKKHVGTLLDRSLYGEEKF